MVCYDIGYDNTVLYMVVCAECREPVNTMPFTWLFFAPGLGSSEPRSETYMCIHVYVYVSIDICIYVYVSIDEIYMYI